MLLAANVAHRKDKRPRWDTSENFRQAAQERDHISDMRRFAGRSRTGPSRLLKVTSGLERTSDSGAVRGVKDTLMVLDDIRSCPAPGSGGSTTLSVTDRCRWRGGDGTSMRLRVSTSMINIAHISRKN